MRSGLLKMRRPEVDFPIVRYKFVNFGRENDQSGGLRQRYYLTQSVFKVVLQKSIPPQIGQLILCYY